MRESNRKMRAARAALGMALAGAALHAAPAEAQVAVRGETVYTMAGEPISDGVVLIRDGRIERVGPAAQVSVPQGYRQMTARVVTPGLIDARSVVGLAGILGQADDQDQLETSDPIQPHLRAFDAYDAQDGLVAWIRDLGVTTVHTGHGPGALASGQTMVVKTTGDNMGEALVDSVTMIAFTLGPDVGRNFRSPGTSAKGVAMLREAFLGAREYAARMEGPADERPARDLKKEALARVLDGSVAALVTANTAPEILAALRLAEEFGFRLVLDGAAEAYRVIPEIQAAGVPVVLHPTMVRPGGGMTNASMETARTLRDAGIVVALQSGFEPYVPKTRVVLFEAGMAAANGLSFEEALRTITIDAARVIGLDERIGSLEAGKDGDVVLYDGDPFEFTSHVCGVIIGGEVVSETCR